MGLVSRISVPFRALVLFLICATPFAAIGGALYDWKGALAGAVLVLLILLIFLKTAEDAMAFHLDADSKIPAGLETTFQRAVSQVDPYLKHLPRLRIFADPRSRAIYLRALGSAGCIYVSRGLLASMDETRLREVIAEGYRRIQRPGARLRTLCAIVTLWLYRIAPGDNQPRTVFRTFIFWMIWPYTRILDSICGEAPSVQVTGVCRTALGRSFPLPGDISL